MSCSAPPFNLAMHLSVHCHPAATGPMPRLILAGDASQIDHHDETAMTSSGRSSPALTFIAGCEGCASNAESFVCCLLQEANGDFFLAFRSASQAAQFCLQVSSGQAYAMILEYSLTPEKVCDWLTHTLLIVKLCALLLQVQEEMLNAAYSDDVLCLPHCGVVMDDR